LSFAVVNFASAVVDLSMQLNSLGVSVCARAALASPMATAIDSRRRMDDWSRMTDAPLDGGLTRSGHTRRAARGSRRIRPAGTLRPISLAAPDRALCGAMEVSPPPAARADRHEIGIVVGAALVSLTVAGIVLAAGDAGREATRLALRLTARLSFVYFMVAFVASPLARLRPGALTRWLVRRRRAFGVAFGASMSIHVGCILRLYALYAPERPPMVTDADFLIGVPGLVLVALMTVTSAIAVRRRMTPIAWRRLHRTGLYAVWSIFFLCLVDSVSRKETLHPIAGYYAFIAVLLAGMALRLGAARRLPSPGRGATPSRA
jgi:DMSO/TMAO reductase YedYZ heme-binding membrane subunit